MGIAECGSRLVNTCIALGHVGLRWAGSARSEHTVLV